MRNDGIERKEQSRECNNVEEKPGGVEQKDNKRSP